MMYYPYFTGGCGFRPYYCNSETPTISKNIWPTFKELLVYLSLSLSFHWPLCPHSVRIVGWCCSNPRTEYTGALVSVPIWYLKWYLCLLCYFPDTPPHLLIPPPVSPQPSPPLPLAPLPSLTPPVTTPLRDPRPRHLHRFLAEFQNRSCLNILCDHFMPPQDILSYWRQQNIFPSNFWKI